MMPMAVKQDGVGTSKRTRGLETGESSQSDGGAVILVTKELLDYYTGARTQCNTAMGVQ